jgi:hypothetical protein
VKAPVRIATLSVPRFMHGGLEVNDRWSEFPATPTERERAALRDYHGRFIQVHPDDRDKLRELGLKFEDANAPLVEIPKPKATGGADKKPDKDTKHGTANGGTEKKEG